MSPLEFSNFHSTSLKRNEATLRLLDGIGFAPENTESKNEASDIMAEGLFLRAFCAYENDLEALFLHYVSGGRSLDGLSANTLLNVETEADARNVVFGGKDFLNWANPGETRSTASRYLENGWPINQMMNNQSQNLSDCTFIRNHIAHNSHHSQNQFDKVQRNLFRTERVFPFSPGQLLRTRHRKNKSIQIEYYLNALHVTLLGIMRPPTNTK